MSVEIRRAHERGHFDFGWLETYHSFSFGDYHAPEHMAFGPLRVLNEDFIQPGQGFGEHSHRDMEIVTYVLSGTVAHRDSTGGEGKIPAGEVQRMSAGRGITHSEYNASATEPVHLLQVWFRPERPGLPPGYQQDSAVRASANRFAAVATPSGTDGALKIHQDVSFNVVNLEVGKTVTAAIGAKRIGYLHNAMVGAIEVNGQRLEPGDGLKITGPETLTVTGLSAAKVVLFDMLNLVV